MLRRARPADAGRLAAPHVAVWRETYAGPLPGALLASLSVKTRLAMWTGTLCDPAGTVVHLVEEDATLIGFGTCGGQRNPNLRQSGVEAEIGAPHLLRAHRQRGLGRAQIAYGWRGLAPLLDPPSRDP